MGETASGKTDLAEALADELGAQLVNADAFQVYRRMDVGTAKSARKDEYRLVDLIDPNVTFGAGHFTQLAAEVLRECHQAGKDVILVGGSGLYVRALFEGYSEMGGPPDADLRAELNARRERDGLESLVEQLKELDPSTAAVIDLKNPMRVQRAIERKLRPIQTKPVDLPPFRRLKIAIRIEESELVLRLRQRTQKMMHNGWIEEVSLLKHHGFRLEDPGLRAIGYRSLWRHLDGEISREEALEEIERDTRRFAKRQRTWLRAEPNLLWVGPAGTDGLQQQVAELLG